MRTRLAFVLVGVLGCAQSGPSAVDEVEPATPAKPEAVPTEQPTETPTEQPVETPTQTPTETPTTTPVASPIAVQMTAATLADDCGGGPNIRHQAAAKAAKARRVKADQSEGASSKAKRRCEQSSIQLAISAPAGIPPAQMAVKSVELLLESGESVGMLEARAPSLWSDADGYMPWDQKIGPAQELSVSYALGQPDWSTVDDRWNQTFTVKAVLSIAGADRSVQQSVAVAAPTSLPPGVKT